MPALAAEHAMCTCLRVLTSPDTDGKLKKKGFGRKSELRISSHEKD
jgi:hypothetical protein